MPGFDGTGSRGGGRGRGQGSCGGGFGKGLGRGGGGGLCRFGNNPQGAQGAPPGEGEKAAKEIVLKGRTDMHIIAVSSEGPSLDDQVDPRFGRAAGFVVVDVNTMETRYIDNGQSQVMAQGAGIQAAELMARAGVECLLTGFVGPKAFAALQAARIQVAQNLEGLTVGQAVERFKNGQVDMAQAANRAGR